MNVAKQWRNSSMNAMQKMTEGMIKENQPKVEVEMCIRDRQYGFAAPDQ